MWRAVLGLPLLVVAVAVTALRAHTVRAGHPAYAVLLAVGALAGLLLMVGALRDLGRVPGLPRRRRGAVVTGRVLAGLLAAVVVGSTVYLVPFPGTPAAIAALAGSTDVMVSSSPTTVTFTPRGGPVTTGLVFQPGARVDPRGGHSLGGVAASSYAGGRYPTVTGLLLWASHPLGSLTDSGLRVASVPGTRDGLATPADIAASRPDVPADTTCTAVEGGCTRSSATTGSNRVTGRRRPTG